MVEQPIQRVRIEQRNGQMIYVVPAWPGWQDVSNAAAIFLILFFILAVMFFVSHQVNRMFDHFFDIPWLDTLLSFIFAGCIDPILMASLGFVLILLPFYMVYQVSPKEFWIEDQCLCHRYRMASLWWRTRRIPFDRILEISVKTSRNNRLIIYNLTAVYEMNLPKWLFIILVHWNERFTQWALTIVNGIPTKEEAEALQIILLEPMTQSGKRRMGVSQ